MVKMVPLDNMIRAFPYPSIRLDEPERVVKGAFLGMKLVKYCCSRKMVCVVALSARQLTSLLDIPRNELIELVTCINISPFSQLSNSRK